MKKKYELNEKLIEVIHNERDPETIKMLKGELLEANSKLISWRIDQLVGNGFYSTGVIDKDDLYQQGCLGLLHACDKYADDSTAKFSTYALFYIDRYIIQELKRHSYCCRVPDHVGSRLYKALNNQDVDICAEERRIISTVPVEHIAYDYDMDTSLCINEFRELLESDNIQKRLNDRELKYIKLRFGFGNDCMATLDEIGRQDGITRARVAVIIANGIRKLRNSLYERQMFDIDDVI